LQYALVNGFEPKKEVRRQLVFAAEKAGDMALALEQSKALIAEPDADLAAFERTVTLALAEKHPEDAYQVAQSAVKKWPESAKALELLGWSAAETDRTQEAREALEKALQLEPRLSSAREKLNKL
jgi:Flp pilus assembly protein TadD